MAWTTSTVLLYASLAATAVGTGVSVYGQQQAKESQERADAANAIAAKHEARNKELEAHENARRARDEKRRRLAAAKSRLAANGVALGEGTGADVMEVLDMRLETEIQDAGRRAAMEARAIRQRQALDSWESGQQSAALDLQSYGTALGGVTKAAGSYSNFQYKQP